MTKPENFKTAPRAVVRHDFAECATYRPALPGCVPLFALSIDGPLDAPENMPAGSMRASKYGPFGETFYRN